MAFGIDPSLLLGRRGIDGRLLQPLGLLPMQSMVTGKEEDISNKVPLKDQFSWDTPKKNPMEGVGGILGMLLGVGGGILSNSVKREEDRARAREMRETMMRSKTVEPSFYASKGGIVGGLDPVIAVQSKKGEVAYMPNGLIVDVHSNAKKHTGTKEVTDMLPAGTYIGSDKKISKERASKVEIGQKVDEYSEFKKGSPVKSIKLDVLYGKKKDMTVAELLKATKDMLKVPKELDDNIYDPYATETAKENMAQRDKYVSAIMALDMGKRSLSERLKYMKNA